MKVLLLTYVGLLGLLGLTLALALLPMGVGNLAVNLLIATAKALLIALVFMSLLRQETLIRLAAVSGLLWLLILFWLTLNDVLTRV